MGDDQEKDDLKVAVTQLLRTKRNLIRVGRTVIRDMRDIQVELLSHARYEASIGDTKRARALNELARRLEKVRAISTRVLDRLLDETQPLEVPPKDDDKSG